MFNRKMEIRRAVKLSDTKEQGLEWLWKPYIPLGKITVVHGIHGVGKSIFMARLAAACTGAVKNCGIDIRENYQVLYFTADDDLSEMLRPRLAEAGADLSQIYAVHDLLPFALGDDSVEQIIEEHQTKVVIVDPIQEYLDHDVYETVPEDTYPVILKLADIAKRYGCAVILVAYSDGLNGEKSMLWREFAEKVSSILCIEPKGTTFLERTLIHEKCLFVPEGPKWEFQLNAPCERIG